ncbi:hypothetical protein SynA1524_01570 [Synechococcus sp. A15-24]|nr:hypothetical protein SynA1524_01570 [Synechococcus sp. A15-24]
MSIVQMQNASNGLARSALCCAEHKQHHHNAFVTQKQNR